LDREATGIVIVDHGSHRAESNRRHEAFVEEWRDRSPYSLVEAAHMELAEPDIAAGFSGCVQAGATDVTVFPYMLSPGRHSTADIPRIVASVARAFPKVSFSVTPAFGLHEKLAEVVLERAGIGANAN